MKPRMRLLALATLVGCLLVAPSLVPSSAQSPRPLGERFIAGRLLVAAPSMPDPRFRETIILMMDHSEKGAIGFVVNRVIGRQPIRDVLTALNQPDATATGEIEIHWGGPVSPNTAVVIHSKDYDRPGSKTIAGGDFRISGKPGVVADIGRGKGPKRYAFARGYAGWGPGQLERELQTKHWIVIPAEPGLVFPKDRDGAWARALKRRGTDL